MPGYNQQDYQGFSRGGGRGNFYSRSNIGHGGGYGGSDQGWSGQMRSIGGYQGPSGGTNYSGGSGNNQSQYSGGAGRGAPQQRNIGRGGIGYGNSGQGRGMQSRQRGTMQYSGGINSSQYSGVGRGSHQHYMETNYGQFSDSYNQNRYDYGQHPNNQMRDPLNKGMGFTNQEKFQGGQGASGRPQPGMCGDDAANILESLSQLSMMGNNAQLALNIVDILTKMQQKQQDQPHSAPTQRPHAQMRTTQNLQQHQRSNFNVPQKTWSSNRGRQVSYPTGYRYKNLPQYTKKPFRQNIPASGPKVKTYKSTNSSSVTSPQSTSKDKEKKPSDTSSTNGTKGQEKKEGSIKEEKEQQPSKYSEDLKQGDEIPVEALQCHICGLTKFNSLMTYLTHINSRNHDEMAHIFHEKAAAVLQLLRADAKLACQREIGIGRKNGVRGPILRCFKCQCPFMGDLRKHVKTLEHQLVINYLNPRCCGRPYPNRMRLEEHRVSLTHLQMQVQKEKQKARKELSVEGDASKSVVEQSSVPESLEKIQSALKEMKISLGAEETLTAATLPPYDPANPLGVNFINKTEKFECGVCWDVFEPSPEGIESHCRSIRHYSKLSSHLHKLQEKEMAEERRKREENKADKSVVKDAEKSGSEKKSGSASKKERKEDKILSSSNSDSSEESEEECAEFEDVDEEAESDWEDTAHSSDEEGDDTTSEEKEKDCHEKGADDIWWDDYCDSFCPDKCNSHKCHSGRCKRLTAKLDKPSASTREKDNLRKRRRNK